MKLIAALLASLAMIAAAPVAAQEVTSFTAPLAVNLGGTAGVTAAAARAALDVPWLTGANTWPALQSFGQVSLLTGTTAPLTAAIGQTAGFGVSAGHVADFYLNDTSGGTHLSTDYTPLVINSVPLGSGVNGPANADYGFQVSVVKKNLATSMVVGELDGLNSFTRNAYGDTAGYLTNVGVGHGAAYIMEGSSAQFSDDFTTILKQWDVQLGGIETGYTGTAFSWGTIIDALVGSNDGGLLIRTQSGASMGDAIHVQDNNDGPTTYTVTPAGFVTDTGEFSSGDTTLNSVTPGGATSASHFSIFKGRSGSADTFGYLQIGSDGLAMIVTPPAGGIFEAAGDVVVDGSHNVIVGGKVAVGGCMAGINAMCVAGAADFSGTSSATGFFNSATGAFLWAGRGYLSAPADGVVEFLNNASGGFTGAKFGGVTASFPYLKVDGAGFDVRLGDDSGYSFIKASAYYAGATAGVTCSGSPTVSFAATNGLVTHC